MLKNREKSAEKYILLNFVNLFTICRLSLYIYKTLATKIIATFQALILTLNNLVFNSKFYPQIKGCAMGTIFALACANIFMVEFEQKYI